MEFLNEQMKPAEILALELRHFAGEGLKAIIPTVYGQTERAQQRKDVRASRLFGSSRTDGTPFRTDGTVTLIKERFTKEGNNNHAWNTLVMNFLKEGNGMAKTAEIIAKGKELGYPIVAELRYDVEHGYIKIDLAEGRTSNEQSPPCAR